MRVKLAVLLAILASFLGVSAGSAQAYIYQVQTNNAPTYTGGDGTGSWYGDFHVQIIGATTYQVRATQYLYVDNLFLMPGTGVPWPYNNATLTTSVTVGRTLISNTPSNCPYPGFHNFSTIASYQTRTWVAGLGQWSGWTGVQWTASVLPNIYGQACL